MDEIAERIARNKEYEYKNVNPDAYLADHIRLWQEHHGDNVTTHLFPYVKPSIFLDKTVLEVGCGFGGGVLKLWQVGAKAYGLDINPDAIEIAKLILKDESKERISGNIFCIAVGENIPFKNNTFDIVFSINVLEHVQNPTKVIRESVRVLKPGGFLFIHAPNYLYPYEGHYRLWILPMMPKILLKIYLKFRRRDVRFMETINYITPNKIESVLKKLPVRYKNMVEERLMDSIETPVNFKRGYLRVLLLKNLKKYKHLTLILAIIRWICKFNSTIVFIAEKDLTINQSYKKEL